jgi:hypothetical protein
MVWYRINLEMQNIHQKSLSETVSPQPLRLRRFSDLPQNYKRQSKTRGQIFRFLA